MRKISSDLRGRRRPCIPQLRGKLPHQFQRPTESSTLRSPQQPSLTMPPPVPGTDKQQPPQTVGWKLNHICFRIRDPERTIHFYRDILGMRTVFTVDYGSFSILYFGYPEVVGQHETGKEMLRNRHNREGLIEFIHIHVSSPRFRSGGLFFSILME